MTFKVGDKVRFPGDAYYPAQNGTISHVENKWYIVEFEDDSSLWCDEDELTPVVGIPNSQEENAMTFKVGDKVRVNDPKSIQHGQSAVVTLVSENEKVIAVTMDAGYDAWFYERELVGIPNTMNPTLAFVIIAAGFSLITGFGLGLLVNFNGADPQPTPSSEHTPDVLCNNMSANDGPQYEERDITAYEFDKYCR